MSRVIRVSVRTRMQQTIESESKQPSERMDERKQPAAPRPARPMKTEDLLLQALRELVQRGDMTPETKGRIIQAKRASKKGPVISK